MLFAVFIILTGVVFLLKNLGIISSNTWGILWPLFLIVFGFYLILKAHRSRMFWRSLWNRFERK